MHPPLEALSYLSKRHPVVGIALGALLVLAGIVVLPRGIIEGRRLSALASIESITLADVPGEPATQLRNVRLLGGRWRCDLEVFGRDSRGRRTSASWIPVEDEGGVTRVVLHFEGESRCSPEGRVVEGLLARDGAVDGASLPLEMLTGVRGPLPTILVAGWKPPHAWGGVVISALLAVMGTLAMAFHSREFARRRRADQESLGA